MNLASILKVRGPEMCSTQNDPAVPPSQSHPTYVSVPQRRPLVPDGVCLSPEANYQSRSVWTRHHPVSRLWLQQKKALIAQSPASGSEAQGRLLSVRPNQGQRSRSAIPVRRRSATPRAPSSRGLQQISQATLHRPPVIEDVPDQMKPLRSLSMHCIAQEDK